MLFRDRVFKAIKLKIRSSGMGPKPISTGVPIGNGGLNSMCTGRNYKNRKPSHVQPSEIPKPTPSSSHQNQETTVSTVAGTQSVVLCNSNSSKQIHTTSH